jgi:hypothetical protein
MKRTEAVSNLRLLKDKIKGYRDLKKWNTWVAGVYISNQDCELFIKSIRYFEQQEKRRKEKK